MSTAHHAHAAGAHDHDFDGEPARDLPADEPRTPGWIPAVGAALFVAAGVAFLIDLGPAPAPEPPAKAPAAAPAPVRVEPRPQPPAAAPPATPPPPPSGSLKKLTPEQMDMIKRQLERSRKPGGAFGKDQP
ncbi:MAG: hypothetical protein IT372_03525 [Polyangiaceae bacterium]|nr:hypothetical protein [Polyangiaceae bacterium]